MKKNLRSEAAIKRMLRLNQSKQANIRAEYYPTKRSVAFKYWEGDDYEIIAELDLRDFVKKRQPLTGIKKQVEKIVRGSNAKQKAKKAKEGYNKSNKTDAKRQKAVGRKQ